MKTPLKPECAKRIYDNHSYKGRGCSKPGKLEHEGKFWCSLHHPPTLKAKREENFRVWKAESEEKQRKLEEHSRKMKEQKRKAEAFDELLAAVIEARHTLQFANDNPGGAISDTIWMMHGGPETLFDFLDAAIEKAQGGNHG